MTKLVQIPVDEERYTAVIPIVRVSFVRLMRPYKYGVLLLQCVYYSGYISEPVLIVRYLKAMTH